MGDSNAYNVTYALMNRGETVSRRREVVHHDDVLCHVAIGPTLRLVIRICAMQSSIRQAREDRGAVLQSHKLAVNVR